MNIHWTVKKSLSFTFCVILMIYFILVMYMCLIWLCAHKCYVHKGSKRLLDPMKPELKVVVSCSVWVLGTYLRSSARASNTLNLRHLISLCFLKLFFLKLVYKVLNIIITFEARYILVDFSFSWSPPLPYCPDLYLTNFL